MFGVIWLLGFLALLLCVMTFAVWFAAGRTHPQWNSLLSSLMGMAMGGGAVWAVRIVASNALGQEAMGFGDVTLMAMVGTFLGWQASLMVFALAPFAALIIAAIQFTMTKNRELAFGPYLAFAALVVIIGWSPLWQDNARLGFFQMQGLLLGVLAASLVMMAVMLFGLRWMRGDE
jgi:prepilin signal peptidase PulO-like enzyme (type II secretory pathway)